ncbi:hypothetical protein GH714_036991 [Hevea brasiliensis]|uniref:Uncharacterized protein n=1 Tax=Hevea brasiliensis TaxID=3981 RepID=A0A6A6MSI0_HEVBR|nr:hypothetical protein GH714_036991 [Hevea brasiliensis]
MPPSNQSPLLVAGAPPIGILRTTSANAKVANSSVPVLQSQHGDNSLTGSGQKTSPVCGRNVPSILSACPSHLSELKYYPWQLKPQNYNGLKLYAVQSLASDPGIIHSCWRIRFEYMYLTMRISQGRGVTGAIDR